MGKRGSPHQGTRPCLFRLPSPETDAALVGGDGDGEGAMAGRGIFDLDLSSVLETGRPWQPLHR